jgi:small subunit ribosomal protein S14
MASKGSIEREKKIRKIINKYYDLREELKKQVKDLTLAPKERTEAMLKLDALPKNSSKIRARNRCVVTGNPRSYFRQFQMSRHAIRSYGAEGKIPGLKKCSW